MRSTRRPSRRSLWFTECISVLYVRSKFGKNVEVLDYAAWWSQQSKYETWCNGFWQKFHRIASVVNLSSSCLFSHLIIFILVGLWGRRLPCTSCICGKGSHLHANIWPIQWTTWNCCWPPFSICKGVILPRVIPHCSKILQVSIDFLVLFVAIVCWFDAKRSNTVPISHFYARLARSNSQKCKELSDLLYRSKSSQECLHALGATPEYPFNYCNIGVAPAAPKPNPISNTNSNAQNGQRNGHAAATQNHPSAQQNTQVKKTQQQEQQPYNSQPEPQKNIIQTEQVNCWGFSLCDMIFHLECQILNLHFEL